MAAEQGDFFFPETAPRDDESHIRNRATEVSYWYDRSNATLRPMSRVDPEMAAHDRVFNGAVVASKRFHSANGTRFAVSLYLRPHRCSGILVLFEKDLCRRCHFSKLPSEHVAEFFYCLSWWMSTETRARMPT